RGPVDHDDLAAHSAGPDQVQGGKNRDVRMAADGLLPDVGLQVKQWMQYDERRSEDDVSLSKSGMRAKRSGSPLAAASHQLEAGRRERRSSSEENDQEWRQVAAGLNRAVERIYQR